MTGVLVENAALMLKWGCSMRTPAYPDKIISYYRVVAGKIEFPAYN